MTNVILTGFEPFGPYPVNPTADLAQQFDKKIIGDRFIRSVVLPATYHSAADKLLAAIQLHQPERIISFGLSSSVPKLRIEACGRNGMASKYADASGLCYAGRKIEDGGPEIVRPNYDVVSLATAIHGAGVPIEISVNADAFICNALIYMTIRRMLEGCSPAFVFIHIPWPDRYLDQISLETGKITIPWENLVRAAEVALTCPLNSESS